MKNLSLSVILSVCQETFSMDLYIFIFFGMTLGGCNNHELAEWDFLEKNVFAALGKQPKIPPQMFFEWTLVWETE